MFFLAILNLFSRSQ